MVTTLVIDDAAQDADEVRAQALQMPFETVQYGGLSFDGVGRDVPLTKHFCEMVRHYGRKYFGLWPEIRLAFYRLTRAQDQHPVHIHSDNITAAKWAAIWYLTPDHLCVGGTAFWTHLETGSTELPFDDDTVAGERAWDQDGLDESLWSMNGLIGMRFNRLAIYRSNAWHSRFPMRFPGQTVESGRLAAVAFFDL